MIEQKVSFKPRYLFDGRADVVARAFDMLTKNAASKLGFGADKPSDEPPELPDSFGLLEKFSAALTKYVAEITQKGRRSTRRFVLSPAIQELKNESAKYSDGGVLEIVARFEHDRCTEVLIHVIEKDTE